MAEQAAQTAVTTLAPSPANNNYTLDIWEQRWKDNMIGFHEAGGSALLSNNLEKIMSEQFAERKPEELKVLVPLCGKTKDMYLFYKMGFTVVGIEYTAQAISDFFVENDLTDINTNNRTPFTSSADGRLILAQGDLFSFNDAENPLPYTRYDIIWDRGSFVAINEKDRSKYAKFMQSLIDVNGLYIADVLEYDRREYGGPPLAVTREDLLQYFGPEITLQLLGTEDLTAEGSDTREKWLNRGLTKILEKLYIFK